jgi:hypothetical protein
MKIVYGSIYVHKTNIRELAEVDRDLVATAQRYLAKAHRWNLLKIARDKNSVSFMWYPGFYENPHPALDGSASVNLVTGRVKYSNPTKNPVILHRKETFISRNDHHYEKFQQLTAQEEKAGLYAKNILNKIGRRDYWDMLLCEKEVSIVDHRLQKSDVLNAPIMPISAKTAIGRQSSSVSAKMAVDLVHPNDKIFDWGCGREDDLKYYKANGITAEGWDPHFKPAPHPSELINGSFNFVVCSFVLNVIKDASERQHCIGGIYEFLPDGGRGMFAVRTAKDIHLQAEKGNWGWLQTGGWLTGKGTFQIGFNQAELEKCVYDVFGNAETIRKTPLVVIATK